jgi:hypothetical protein
MPFLASLRLWNGFQALSGQLNILLAGRFGLFLKAM